VSVDSSPGAALRDRFGDAVTTADDEGWDAARLAFNLLVDQQPTAVATPSTAAETAEIVTAARELGLRIAPQGSAHNAGPLGSLDDTLLLRFGRMAAVELDPDAPSARVEAGARWWDVVPAASELGLSALHGSSPEVNVVGYSLGGGIGWQARKHGLQASRVTAIELVTADGAERRVDADHEPDLFWALRGGGGNFGAVTAIEFELLPLRELYAGALFFDFERASEVLHAWRAWTESAPEEATSIGRLIQLPDLELIPEVVRGKSFSVVEVAFLGGEEEGRELLAPLRDLGPEMDTFARVPPAGLSELHMDPVDPVPYMSGHALVGDLPEEAIDELVAATGPGSGSPLLSIELRHGGGALGREAPGAGALAALPGSYMMFGVGAVMAPEMVPPLEATLGRLGEVFAPHDAGRYSSFTEQPYDVAAMFSAPALERLRAVRSRYDPDGAFRACHSV
jgi:FAD/FMN-containing dehydrogenase